MLLVNGETYSMTMAIAMSGSFVSERCSSRGPSAASRELRRGWTNNLVLSSGLCVVRDTYVGDKSDRILTVPFVTSRVIFDVFP